MSKFLIICQCLAMAYCCVEINNCIDCVEQKCQFALLHNGDTVCHKKVSVKDVPNLISVAKTASHCHLFGEIKKVATSKTPPAPKSKSWHLGSIRIDNFTSEFRNSSDIISLSSTPQPLVRQKVAQSVVTETPASTTTRNDATTTEMLASSTPTPTTAFSDSVGHSHTPSTNFTFPNETLILEDFALLDALPAPNIDNISSDNKSVPTFEKPYRPVYLAQRPKEESKGAIVDESILQPLNQSKIACSAQIFDFFTTTELFSIVPDNATCNDMIPEFRYLRTLCTIDSYYESISKELPQDELAHLQQNPAKQFKRQCAMLESLRFCNVARRNSSRQHHPHYKMHTRQFALFDSISSAFSCENYNETLQEMIARLLCRMEYTANSIQWEQFTMQDFAYFALNPAKLYKKTCIAMNYRRRYCVTNA